jgi:hypothetical protein
MSRRRNTFILGSAAIALIACGTSIILISRASTKSSTPAREASAQPRKPSGRHRNLSLKPEALSVSRKLGSRFKPASRSVSTAVGTLTIGGNQQPVVLVRRQTDTGEAVEVKMGNRGLRWSDEEGVIEVSGPPTDAERVLAERLILDSPDQFVLAQLRGASYFTVARNVRPTDAGDDYSGPLWNLVRLDEPQQQEENMRPLSTWRIYYINAQTGLPDRIEYQLNGEDIRTDFVEWTEQNGEKTPSHVTWSSGGQVIMEYRATHVSHDK